MNDQQLIYRLTKELHDLKHQVYRSQTLANEIYHSGSIDNTSVIFPNLLELVNTLDSSEDYSEIEYE